MSRVANRKVIVIGGTSGIGLATGRQLAAEGARVVVASRNPAKVARVREEAAELTVETVDASSVGALQAFFKRHAPVDDLVLTLSEGKGFGQFRELDLSILMEGFDGKFFAQIRSAQLALPFLSRDASITFVTAISARAAHPNTAGLAAINGAIECMVKPLAKDLKPIRVNAVSPGVIETTWWDRLPPEVRQQGLREAAEASLVGRNGTAEDVADVIVLLVRNSFITGTVIEVDGGLRLI